MKELAEILGISSASAYDQVNQLIRKGYLKREPRKARGIVIVRDMRENISDLNALSNGINHMEEKTNGDI